MNGLNQYLLHNSTLLFSYVDLTLCPCFFFVFFVFLSETGRC